MEPQAENVKGGRTVRVPDGIPRCARCGRPMLESGPVVCSWCEEERERREEDQAWRDRGGVEFQPCHDAEWYDGQAREMAQYAEWQYSLGHDALGRKLARWSADYHVMAERIRTITELRQWTLGGNV
ncbi:MAG TPA: hypothetical protein PKK95_02665 [Vicinamibacterales bacterium]|nr:hypothetical protein [Vicinamibacterales bacterium]